MNNQEQNNQQTQVEMVQMPPPPIIPKDALEAIGNPSYPIKWPTDLEMGIWMKAKARRDIDAKKITCKEDVKRFLQARCEWFNWESSFIDEENLRRELKHVQMYCASCYKYLNELVAAENSSKTERPAK